MIDDDKKAMKRALQAISGKARKARLGKSIPESERPAGFMLSIGIRPISEDEKEMMEEVKEEEEEEEEEDE